MNTTTINIAKSSQQSLWSEYLIAQRKLSEQVLQAAKISIHNGNLSIPIMDAQGAVLFHKYRTAPWAEQPQPKYLYEKGGTVALYGIEKMGTDTDEFIVITEGELDCLSVRTAGFIGVSSTGGALSFQEEWAPLFEKRKVIIFFDNDEVGMKGAFRAAKILPHAYVAFIPQQYGKDANDVLRQDLGQKLIRQFLERAVSFHLPGMEGTKKEWQEVVGRLREEVRRMFSSVDGCPNSHRVFLQCAIDELTRLSVPKKRRTPTLVDGDDRAKAILYPIENIITVDRAGFALCPFHTEKTGSLKVYKDNHAFCFGGCNKRYNAIDIEMQIHGSTFLEALKKLSGAV